MFGFLKRAKRRGKAFFRRSFAAASTDRLIGSWKTDFGFTPGEISSYLFTIRSRSRAAAKDSPDFKKWLQLIATNVVGEGFKFKSTPHSVTSNGIVLDETTAKFIMFHWKRFCTHRDPVTGLTWFDETGRKNAAEMDRMNAKNWARDGEYFIQVNKNAQNPYGISFRVLRPDWCDEKYNIADTGHGTLIHCGVEMEIGSRRPVAYWFTSAPQNAHAFNHVTRRGVLRIPVSEIIHGFTQEDEDQPRGIPHAHASLVTLKMLDEYNIAEITASRDEACSVRTYFAPLGEEDEIQDLTSATNSEAANALTAEKEPGQAEIIPLGWQTQINTPQHPNRELTAFKASLKRDIANGFNVEYSNFANDWAGVSFSSVRVGTIAERDSWTVLQDDMISQCKTPQFLMWLLSFLSLSISGQLPMSKFDKFSEHEMRGRRWKWVDPMRDMNADEKAVANGWKTNSQVASDLGTDFDANVEELAREREAISDARGNSTEGNTNVEET